VTDEHPAVVVHLPLEGAPRAYVVCGTRWDERRLMLDLERRELLDDVVEALELLHEALAEDCDDEGEAA
jgi:hypothetical protein